MLSIWPYKQGSHGAHELARQLGIRVLRVKGGSYKSKSGDIIINWGSSRIADKCLKARILNDPKYVVLNANKLSCFKLWDKAKDKPNTVLWTTDKKIAASWKSDVVCRTILNGHSGAGIVIVKKGDTIPDAPLYTKYLNKSEEYRVHVVGGLVSDVQRKIRDPDKEPKNWQVRSHDNGFIFVRGGISPSELVLSETKKAFIASGLNFGAFDVIIDKDKKAYILEVNCSPGLEGATGVNYARAFKRMLKL